MLTKIIFKIFPHISLNIKKIKIFNPSCHERVIYMHPGRKSSCTLIHLWTTSHCILFKRMLTAICSSTGTNVSKSCLTFKPLNQVSLNPQISFVISNLFIMRLVASFIQAFQNTLLQSSPFSNYSSHQLICIFTYMQLSIQEAHLQIQKHLVAVLFLNFIFTNLVSPPIISFYIFLHPQNSQDSSEKHKNCI